MEKKVLLGKEFNICIFDIDILITTKDENINLYILEYFAPFIAPPKQKYDAYVVVQFGAPPLIKEGLLISKIPLNSFVNGVFTNDYFWGIYKSEDRYLFVSYNQELTKFPYMGAVCDFNFKKWDVYIDEDKQDNEIAINPFSYPVGIIMIIHIIQIYGGVLMHASGVYYENNGLLFCGVSGIGKSTMATIWKEKGAFLLSDDRVILKHLDNDLYMSNTPLYYEQHDERCPVSNIFLLQQSKQNYLTKINKSEAIARLMASSILQYHNEEIVNNHIDFFIKVVNGKDIYELGFVPDENIIPFVLSRI